MYNDLGVLRDIHQSHLTELLTLVTMDIPSSFLDTRLVNENKERLLSQIETVQMSKSLFAQYAEYNSEPKGLSLNISIGDQVPTFAATMLNINSPRWKSVPFVLVSGKTVGVIGKAIASGAGCTFLHYPLLANHSL